MEQTRKPLKFTNKRKERKEKKERMGKNEKHIFKRITSLKKRRKTSVCRKVRQPLKIRFLFLKIRKILLKKSEFCPN